MVALVYGLHALFWAPYIGRAIVDRASGVQQSGKPAHAAAGARVLVWLHSFAFGVTYFGIGRGLFGADVFSWSVDLRWLGVATMLAATALSVRVMQVFRSWRLRAELTAQHELCTEGPFRIIRHPIYAALVLLTVASFLLVPNVLTALGVVANFAAGDVRARTEEKLLLAAFGERYATYMQRTKRFVPGIY